MADHKTIKGRKTWERRFPVSMALGLRQVALEKLTIGIATEQADPAWLAVESRQYGQVSSGKIYQQEAITAEIESQKGALNIHNDTGKCGERPEKGPDSHFV